MLSIQKTNLELGQISDIACAIYGVSQMDFLSGRRQRPLPQARMLATLLAIEYTAASYPQIGNRFNRDHTTIIYQLNAARKNNSEEFATKLKEARSWLQRA